MSRTPSPHPSPPLGGEGARRAGEGDSAWFMVPMRGRRTVETLHEPPCSAGVPPASSTSVSLDESPGGETPPEFAAVDGCARTCWFKVPIRGKKTAEVSSKILRLYDGMPPDLFLIPRLRSTTTSLSFKQLATLRIPECEKSYEIRWELGTRELVFWSTHRSNYFKLRRGVKGRSQVGNLGDGRATDALLCFMPGSKLRRGAPRHKINVQTSRGSWAGSSPSEAIRVRLNCLGERLAMLNRFEDSWSK